jgi:NADH-quinone oxidoreductase subunit C
VNDEQLLELCARAKQMHANVGEPVVEFGELSIDVPAESLIEVVTFLKAEGPFEQLADASAIDWLGHEPDERRFLVSVQLASISHPLRLRLRVWLPSEEPRCPSLTSVWIGAEALEREMYDFFGITFDGNPNLTRIFMPDEWIGYPQRKDYPLGGIDVSYEHGQAVTPPDERARRATTTTGYPGRTS